MTTYRIQTNFTNKFLCLSLLFNTYHDQCLFVCSFLLLFFVFWWKIAKRQHGFLQREHSVTNSLLKIFAKLLQKIVFLRSVSLHSCRCQSSRNLPRDACHHASIRELKRKILVPMTKVSTKIKATPHKNCDCMPLYVI